MAVPSFAHFSAARMSMYTDTQTPTEERYAPSRVMDVEYWRHLENMIVQENVQSIKFSILLFSKNELL